MRRRVTSLAESLEERAALGDAFILRGVLEGDARLGDVAIGLRANPCTRDGRGNLDPARGFVGLQRHIGPGLPLAVAAFVYLQREGGRGRAVVL